MACKQRLNYSLVNHRHVSRGDGWQGNSWKTAQKTKQDDIHQVKEGGDTRALTGWHDGKHRRLINVELNFIKTNIMAPPTLMGKAAVVPHPGDHAPSGEHMDVECPICYQEYNPYNKCPRMLECLHAFCTECLQRIQLCPFEAEDPHSPPAMPCPLCRHLTPLETGDARSLPCNSRILARLSPMAYTLPVTVASHLSTVTQRVVLSFEGDDRDSRYIILPTVSLRVQQMHPDRPYGAAPGLMGEEEVMHQSRRTMFWVQVLAVLFWVIFVVVCVFGVVFGPHVLYKSRQL